MTLTPLGQAICNLPLVENLRTSLARQSSLQDFPAVRGESPDEPAGWERALGLASVLAGEDDESAQDFALRVAQGVLRDSAARAHEREAAVVLLERMGNRPSIELAVSRKQAAPESWAQAPAPLALAVVRRRLELSIPLSDGSTIAANPFQRLLALESTQWISVSAPTSAGKSYLVRRWF